MVHFEAAGLSEQAEPRAHRIASPKATRQARKWPVHQGFGSRLLASSPALKAALKPRKVLIATKTMGAPRITRAIILTGMDVVAFRTTR